MYIRTVLYSIYIHVCPYIYVSTPVLVIRMECDLASTIARPPVPPVIIILKVPPIRQTVP